MSIGKHMAVLNLFQEPDGTFEITVAGTTQECMAIVSQMDPTQRPIDHIEEMILSAAKRMSDRNEH